MEMCFCDKINNNVMIDCLYSVRQNCPSVPMQSRIFGLTYCTLYIYIVCITSCGCLPDLFDICEFYAFMYYW